MVFPFSRKLTFGTSAIVTDYFNLLLIDKYFVIILYKKLRFTFRIIFQHNQEEDLVRRTQKVYSLYWDEKTNAYTLHLVT